MATGTKMKVAKVFDITEYKGGGTIIVPGLYRVVKARFVMFDFMGRAKIEKAALSLEAVPVDKDYKNAGDAITQFFPGGLHIPGSDTEEFIARQAEMRPSKNGKQLEIPEDTEISKRCSLFHFMESLGKHGFDMDAAQDDVAVLDGQVLELGVIDDPDYKPKVSADDDEGGSKKKPQQKRQIVVVTAYPKQKSSGSSKASKAAAEDDEPAAKAKSDDGDATNLLKKYLKAKVCIEANEDGLDRMLARSGVKKFVLNSGGDEETAKAVQKLLSEDDTLGAILTTYGWELKQARDGSYNIQKES